MNHCIVSIRSIGSTLALLSFLFPCLAHGQNPPANQESIWVTSITPGRNSEELLVTMATGLPLRPGQLSTVALSQLKSLQKQGETEASAWKSCRFDDGNRYLATDYAGNIYAGALADSAQWKKLDIKTRWSRAACAVEGKCLIGTEDGKIISMAQSDLAVSAPIDAHSAAIMSLRPSADRKQFISCSGDGKIKIWNSQDLQPIKEISVGSQAVWDAVFVLNGSMVVTGDADRRVNLFDMSTGKLVMCLGIIADWATAIESLPNDLVAVGSMNGKVYVFDCQARIRVGQYDGPGSGVWSMHGLQDGRKLVIGTRSHGLHVLGSELWDDSAKALRAQALAEQPPSP